MATGAKIVLLIAFAALALKLGSTFLTHRSKEQRLTLPDELYLALRDQALRVKREQIGLPVPPHPGDPFAVVMDWDLSEGTATVVAISDGTASMYYSSGGGAIGGAQSRDSIRQAAQQAVTTAAEFRPQMQKVTKYPLPQRGQVVFYLLTDDGVFTQSAPQESLASARHPLSKLGNAMQNVITQYRLAHTNQ